MEERHQSRKKIQGVNEKQTVPEKETDDNKMRKTELVKTSTSLLESLLLTQKFWSETIGIERVDLPMNRTRDVCSKVTHFDYIFLIDWKCSRNRLESAKIG